MLEHPFRQPTHEVSEEEMPDEVALQLVHKFQREQRISAASAIELEKMLARDEAIRSKRELEADERGPITDRILTYTELRSLPRPAALIPDVLYTGSVAVLLGDSQVGKTWVTLSLGACGAAGVRWPMADGHTQPLNVLYVAAEDGGSIGARLEHWERAKGLSLDDSRLHAHPEAINILDPVQIEELAQVIRGRQYRMLIIDTVAASLGGEDETNENFSRMIRHCRTLAAAMREAGGGSVVLVHHFGKDKSKGARGGSSLFNDSDIVWELEGDMDAIFMRCKKWKIDSIRPTISLKLDRSEPDQVHIVEVAPEPYSAGTYRSQDELLVGEILKTVERFGHLNQGYGPTGYAIRGALRDQDVKFRESTVVELLAVLEADGRLLTRKGARNAILYRLPPTQDDLFRNR